MAAALLVRVGRSFTLRAGQPDAVAAARTPLVAEYCKGSERYGHLNDDRAEREQPDFSLGLRIHGSLNAQRHGPFRGLVNRLPK
jgi:hypothetical protein